MRIQGLRDGRDHEGGNALVKTVGNEESDADGEQGIDQPLAQLLQMFQQAHAGQFGSIAHSGAGAVQQINHE